MAHITAFDYHQATKHHFNRFARSTGYLDWATQPDPFRRYSGAPVIALARAPFAGGVPYTALYEQTAPAAGITDASVAEFLRCSMGLSAWKQYQSSRWALRVNPSSGNLHPTEAYLIRDGQVFHYASREHVIEQRCVLDEAGWNRFSASRPGFLVGLTSIHWREAWKYGERAFRYCQHDAGHAIAALRFAAALLGWRLALLPRWSSVDLGALLGTDRDSDFGDAERDEPECIAVVTPDDTRPWLDVDPEPLVDAARRGRWSGHANTLSRARVEWPIIDEVTRATRYPGITALPPVGHRTDRATHAGPLFTGAAVTARQIILQRRSAVAFDGRSSLPRERFFAMLGRTQPVAPPWDAIDWPPHIHLLLFVHRVEGLTPGIYGYLRDRAVLPEWRAATRSEFLWEQVTESTNPKDSNDSNGLFLLLPFDVTWVANRVSCDQDIAADGFFSLGMIARFESALRARGDWFYRRLFWEAGILGQILYLEAEAAGARATGIGCYYDDPVHEAAGLSGTEWQSVYHLAMGMPVEDARLTTAPGYEWEK